MSSGAASLPQRKVCPWVLRAKFDEGRHLERIASGELAPYSKHPGRPAPSGANEPVGGSGLLDPKWLLDDGEALQNSHGDDTSCADCQPWRPRALAAQRQS
jgi:hypothetical protein